MNPNVARGPQPHMGEALLHPACWLSMAVWWFNDHLGKGHWPSALTGKLSDLACLVVFPVFVWCLVDSPLRWTLPQAYGENPRRRQAVFGVTSTAIALWFVAINVSPSVGSIHRQLWMNVYAFLSSELQAWGLEWHGFAHHTVDPTDVFTLPGMAVAWYVVKNVVEVRLDQTHG